MDPSTERDLNNLTAVSSSVARITAEADLTMPANTKEQYGPRQEEWKKWCKGTRSFADGEIVTAGKLVLFLEEVVKANGNRKRKRIVLDDGTEEAVEVGYETYEAYVKAIVALYQRQKALSINSHEHPRNETVKTLLKSKKRREAERKRATKTDRGKNTSKDGYSLEELKKVSAYLALEDRFDSYRNRADILIGHHTLQRGDNKRRWQLADMACEKLPAVEGPTPCHLYIIVQDQGKLNQCGKIEYALFMRNRDVEICGVSALAQYLFMRFHVMGEPFPDVACKERDWYNTYLFYASDPQKEMAYSTQYDAYKKFLSANGIQTSKVTHITRPGGTKQASLNGASEDSIRRLGLWANGTMEEVYLSGAFPMEAIRSVADFSPSGRTFYLSRATVHPCEDLQRLIFPEIESLEEKLKQDDVVHIAAFNFLELMKNLRVAFLQDSVLLSEKYSDAQIWKHKIFSDPRYLHFRQESMLAASSEPEEPIAVHLRLLLPELTNVLDTRLQAMSGELKAAAVSAEKNFALQGLSLAKLHHNWNDWTLRFNGAIENFRSTSTPNMPPSTPSTHVQLSTSTTIHSAPSTVTLPADEEETVITNPTIWDIQQVPPVLDPANIYFYEMNRKIKTVHQLWDEYTVGLGQEPAVRHLENTYGPSWRPLQRDRVYFGRRKVIYNFIEHAVPGRSEVEVVGALEAYRAANRISLDALYKEIQSNPTISSNLSF